MSITLSANYVVKNEEEYIKQSIEQVAKIADEILIFDTGSTDNTIKIIKKLSKKYPIRFFETKNYPVKDARNELLKNSKGEWVLIVDGDEVWENPNVLLELPSKFPGISYFEFGFNHYISPTEYTDKHRSRSTRLIKKEDDVYWDGNFPKEMIYDSIGVVRSKNAHKLNRIERHVCFCRDIKFNHYGGIKRGQWRKAQPEKFKPTS